MDWRMKGNYGDNFIVFYCINVKLILNAVVNVNVFKVNSSVGGHFLLITWQRRVPLQLLPACAGRGHGSLAGDGQLQCPSGGAGGR